MTEGEHPEVHTSHKGSLLITLTNIVSECMAMGSGGVAAEQQPLLSAEQELTAYQSDPQTAKSMLMIYWIIGIATKTNGLL